ncbi:accessory factor associated with RNA polymerase II [Thelotrema lepadinum]|nr:accessory factor associated with RNA polymerase II [Thelotrema lepadinum]
MSAPGDSYFAIAKPRVPHDPRRRGPDTFSPISPDLPYESDNALTPEPLGLPTPRPPSHVSQESTPSLMTDNVGFASNLKSRKIALPAIPSSGRRKGRQSDTDEEDLYVQQESSRHHSRHTSSGSNHIHLRRKSRDSQVTDNERYFVASDESASTECSGESLFGSQSQSRKSSGTVPKSPVADDFSSGLRASDFKDDDRADDLFKASPKALRRLGLGTEERGAKISTLPAVGGRQRLRSDNFKEPVYMPRSSQASSLTSSSEDLSATEESRRPSFWKNLASITPGTKKRGHGMRLDLGSPALNFLPTEAQKVATPPISAQPILFDPRVGVSQSHLPNNPLTSPLSPKSNLRTPFEEIETKPTNIQNVFRAQVTTGGEEDAEKKYANIPEHLPNSPLCPKHPRHRSKGTGVCPYHGRN